MKKTIKLLPCPHCGSECVFKHDATSGTDMVYVECLSCGCTTKYCHTEIGTAQRWNRRANLPDSLQRYEIAVNTLIDIAQGNLFYPNKKQAIKTIQTLINITPQSNKQIFDKKTLSQLRKLLQLSEPLRRTT